MKGINQAPAGLMTWAMGRLLPKLVDFLKQEQKLLQTTSVPKRPSSLLFFGKRKRCSFRDGESTKKNLLESLERQLRRMDAIQFKMSQEKQEQLDPHDSNYWSIDAWELSYDIEDTVDKLLLCTTERSETIANQDSFMFMQALLEDIRVRVQNLSACRNVGCHFEATTSTFYSCIEDAFKEARQLLSIHELTAEVTSMMSSSSQGLKKVSICGAGGMGKTTLARAVYDNVKGEFHCSAFVSLGLQPDMKKALRDILIHLGKGTYSYNDLNMTVLDEGQLINELRHFLKNKRFLFAIDDVRDVLSWRTIECALIDSSCGSRIITTSRILDVAEMSDEVLRLKPLSIDSSRELFYATFTSCGQKGTTTFDLSNEQSTEYVLQKCGGIPLAIITIASLLAAKPREEWAKVYNSIGFGDQDNTRKLIQFSYYDLPSQLKTCLLYLSIFSKNNVIEKDTLVWRWVAEGFVHEEVGESSSVFKVGERYLHELFRRSMIQVVENEDTNNYTFRVHDMVLDLICTVAKEENIATILGRDDGGVHHISYQSNAHTVAVHDRVLENHCLTRMSKPKVRSFSVIGCRISSMMSLLSSFKVLRVLYLEGCRLTADGGPDGQKNLAGGLHHLRYLGIRGMNIGNHLPMEIGDLIFLQTLDLAGNINVLPRSVTQLRQLKCLRCVSSSTGLELPEGMGNLTSLEELRLGTVYRSPNLAKDLSKMTELRMLRIYARNGKAWKESLVESLSKLQKMEELELLCDEWMNPCRYVIGPSAFPKVRYLRTNTWLMYQPGAMPCLTSVELQVDMQAFNRANFDFHKLRYFRLLEKARVEIVCRRGAKTEDVEKAEAALRSVAHGHSNRPVLILKKKYCADDDKMLSLFGLHHCRVAPQAMPLELLRKITNDFSKEQELGSGTFGKVYKGVQNDKEIIAVKLLHDARQGRDYEEEFNKEFENLRKLKHPHIVQLLGYCYETKREFVDYNGTHVFADKIYRALCFEYMVYGSLQGHLDDEFHGLDWQTRYNIIKGTCEGLKYLHEGLDSPMYHLDLKPGNILLGKNMVPKLADFGLSKLVCDNHTQSTTSSIGTIKYCPPEYIEQNYVSNKFDIFSLGVVMIETIAGSEGYRKTAEMLSQEFIDHVQENWRKRLQATPAGYNCKSIIYECQQVKRCIEIALDCILSDRKQRPSIGDIISRLNETENVLRHDTMLWQHHI